MQIPIDAQPRRGSDWMESSHRHCASEYLRQTSKEPPSSFISPLRPARLPRASVLQLTQTSSFSFLSTHSAVLLLLISLYAIFTAPSQLSRWHALVPSWYAAAGVQAVPVCLWVYSASVEHRDKGMFDPNLSGRHYLKTVWDHLSIMSAGKWIW